MYQCEAISINLKRVFFNRFGINIYEVSNEFYDKHLLSRNIGLEARDLIYLLFDIEKEFDITISEEDIAAEKFNTFNNIVEIISNQLEKKDKEAI